MAVAVGWRSEAAILRRFYGEEGKSTHRQSTQPVKIFNMGHFASICRVGCTEIWSETRLEFAVGRDCM